MIWIEGFTGGSCSAGTGDAAEGRGVAGEELREAGVAEAGGADLGENVAIVGGDLEVQALVELVGVAAGPLGEDPPAGDAVAHHEHDVAVAVVAAQAAVLGEAAAELGH